MCELLTSLFTVTLSTCCLDMFKMCIVFICCAWFLKLIK